MKKLTILAATSVLLALGASAAVAQDTTKKEARGDVASPPTVASVMLVVNGSLVIAGKVGMLKTETPLRIEFVDVKPIFSSEMDQRSLKESLEKNEEAVKQLRSELKKSDLIGMAVAGHAMKLEVSDVVGAELLDGERLVLYFWKK